jgi:hypothetical protein
MRRMMIGTLMVLTLMGVSAVVAATPAQASEDQCTGGNFCLWEHSNFSGCFRAFSGDISNYSGRTWSTCPGTLMDNRATSVKNEGNSCSVRFFQFPNYSGINLFLYRQGSGNEPYRDGNLSDGTSNDPRPFNDAISSHDWC